MAEHFKSPGKADGDDPRDILWVCVDDLYIDLDLQRQVDETRHSLFRVPWDWDKAEIPTVSERPDGLLVVTEGQHRVLRRQETAPHSHLWAVLRPGTRGGRAEAAAAHGIARGRKGHSALAQWDLRLAAGDPYVTAGDKVMSDLGLVMGGNSALSGVQAAATVLGILSRHGRSADEGSYLLYRTLNTLAHAWPEDYLPGARWEANMLRAVAHLYELNDEVLDSRKLAARLSATSSAETWLKRAKELSTGSHRPPWRVLAELVAVAYNNGMRRDDRKLAW